MISKKTKRAPKENMAKEKRKQRADLQPADDTGPGDEGTATATGSPGGVESENAAGVRDSIESDGGDRGSSDVERP